MKQSRKQKAAIKRIYLQPIDQLWHNLVNMPTEDFKALEQTVENWNQYNCSFVQYAMQCAVLKLIDNAKTYHKC